MAFKPFKFIGKLASKLIPGGGIIADIIAPGKSQQEKNEGLAMLTPIAQFNLTMARPWIAKMIVGVYLLGIVIKWLQLLISWLLKIPNIPLIEIPADLTEFAKVVVTVIVGTRGVEKIVDKIFKKKEKK